MKLQASKSSNALLKNRFARLLSIAELKEALWFRKLKTEKLITDSMHGQKFMKTYWLQV